MADIEAIDAENPLFRLILFVVLYDGPFLQSFTR